MTSHSKQSITKLEENLNAAKHVGDLKGEGDAHLNLGNVYHSICDFCEAIAHHEKHLKIAKQLGDRVGEGSACCNLGNAHQALGAFRRAIDYHKKSLNIAEKVNDKAAKGHAYGNLGNAYRALGDFRKAIKYHETDLNIAIEVGDRAEEGRAYGNIGNVHQALGYFRKAIEYHEKDLQIAKEIGNRAREGRAFGNIGNAYRALGDFRKAAEYHEDDLNISKEVGDRAGEGRAYGNLGNVYNSLGDFQKAIEYHERRLNIAKEVGNRAGEGSAYGNLGIAYHSLGNFRKAIECHEKDLNIAKEVGDRSGKGRAFCNLGNAYQALGAFRKAIDYHKKDLNFALEVGNWAREGRAYGNLGNAYLSLGEFRKATVYFEKHLINVKEVGDRAGEGRAYCNLGNAYQALDNFAKAIEFHEKDLNIAKEVGNRAGEGRANGNLGNAYWSLGDFRKAIEYHRKDLNIAKEVGDRAGEGRAYANLGNASYSLGAFRKAIEFYEKRLTIVIGVGDREGEGGAYGNLGVAYYSLGDFQKSIDYHKKRLRIAKEVGDRAGERRAYSNLSNAYQALGDMQKASKYHKKDSNISKQPGNLVEEGSADSNPSKAHKSHGDIQKTTECHEEQSNNAKEVGDQTEEGITHGSLGGAHSSLTGLRKDADCNEVNCLTSTKELDGRAREEVTPPEINLRGPKALEAYNKALTEGKTHVRRIPIMLIGQDRSGKTSLKKSLRGIRFNPDESSTVGIDVDPSYFKVTSEIWKIGETDQVANDQVMTTYEHNLARLVVENLKEQELFSEESIVVNSADSEKSPMIEAVAQGVNKSNELPKNPSTLSKSRIHDKDDSSANFTISTQFETTKDRENSLKKSRTTVTDLSDDRHAFETSADSKSLESHSKESSNPLASSDIPEEIEILIKKLQEEAYKIEDEQDVYSVFWDFAGESVYYETHPLFLTSKAIYLLVYDLSRDPYERAQPVKKQGVFKKTEDKLSTRPNQDYLDYWMTSVASLSSPDEDHAEYSTTSTSVVIPKKLPPVFLVCSHADEPCGGNNPFDLAVEVFGTLETKPYMTQLYDVFVVDNTKAGLESECPEVVRLRESIVAVAKELPQLKEVIPVKWLRYEKALQGTLDEGHRWIYFEHAKRIASEVCHIHDQQEFLTLLDFLHDQRILMHFDDTPELSKLVVLDPQWLIDVFKKVITVERYNHQEKEFKELWLKLEREGIMVEKLLQHVWGPLIKQHETFETLIAIMEKFSLLCSWPSSDDSCDKQYLVPSMLMSHPPQDITELIASAELPSLFLKFESGQVTSSLFPRLVLQFFQWGQNEVFWSSLHPQLFKNFARFYAAGDENCSVVLLCNTSFIEVVVHRGNVTPNQKGDLQSKLNISCGVQHNSFEMFCAGAVYRQLVLVLECMRKEFCWMKRMRYEAGVVCPVCCHGRLITYCRTHHKEGCEQEECLHFLSESELQSADLFITCNRSAAAINNKVCVEEFAAWFSRPPEEKATDAIDGRLLSYGIESEDNSLAQLPGNVVESLTSRSCDPKEIVLQLKESLNLDETCLEQPNPETKKTIRCLAKRAKDSNRIEVVKHSREITPAGTTGPLLPGNLDIRNIPVCKMRELTIDLSSGEEWKDVAERLGFSPKEIRYLDKRTMNPCDAALATVSQRCDISVDDLYDALTDAGLPVLADTL
ncbi:uncharacterized protein [Montipora capricornis]|uniref:uncharacterized protein n=1 Tax=Montipora capricornis TaxID=246305 RepID=UPI0035F1D831